MNKIINLNFSSPLILTNEEIIMLVKALYLTVNIESKIKVSVEILQKKRDLASKLLDVFPVSTDEIKESIKNERT